MDGYHCFGCAPNNDAGLKLEFEYEDNCVKALWKPDMKFSGYSNVLHGGVLAALADETAAWLIMVDLNTAGMTQSMNIRYLKPAYATSEFLYIYASLVESNERSALVSVSISGPDKNICCLAKLEFFIFPKKIAQARMKIPDRAAFFS